MALAGRAFSFFCFRVNQGTSPAAISATSKGVGEGHPSGQSCSASWKSSSAKERQGVDHIFQNGVMFAKSSSKDKFQEKGSGIVAPGAFYYYYQPWFLSTASVYIGAFCTHLAGILNILASTSRLCCGVVSHISWDAFAHRHRIVYDIPPIKVTLTCACQAVIWGPLQSDETQVAKFVRSHMYRTSLLFISKHPCACQNHRKDTPHKALDKAVGKQHHDQLLPSSNWPWFDC